MQKFVLCDAVSMRYAHRLASCNEEVNVKNTYKKIVPCDAVKVLYAHQLASYTEAVKFEKRVELKDVNSSC